jgi:quinol-cytochrome oxidoreductase complex cytochrome b subunit
VTVRVAGERVRKGVPRERETAVMRLTVRVLLGGLAVLLASGVYLTFFYVPAEAHAWRRSDGLNWEPFVRTVHRVDAALVLALAVAVGILVSLGRSRIAWLAWLMAPIALGGTFTGALLAWDQIGLWAVTVGEDLRGMRALFQSGRVRFVLLGNSKIAPATVLRWFWIHIALWVAVSAIAVALGLRTRRGGEVASVD